VKSSRRSEFAADDVDQVEELSSEPRAAGAVDKEVDGGVDDEKKVRKVEEED
jgi:hypothetical protein